MTQEALKALIHEMEYVLSCINEEKIPFDGDDFHEALRLGKEALAEPEQEPVAWMGTDVDGNPNKFRLNFFSGAIPLFTTLEDRNLIANNEKNGSPCPEFWDWLPKAYNFDGDGTFTKYNMEVAFLAGKRSVATSDTPQERVDETVKQRHEQEPVAWVYPEGLEALKAGKPWTAYGTRQEPNNTALYLSPQPDIPPYAWVTFTPYGDEDDVWYENPEGQLLEGWTYKPLYDTAPPQRKPLGEHEIAQILDRERMKWNKSPPTYEFDLTFARAIEAAHGIKGEA